MLGDAITTELRELYKTFQTCLDLREKYMFNSKQKFSEDPKNKPGWEIYPPPPPPSWPLLPLEQLAKEKARDIDFDIDHVKLPGSHPVSIYTMQYIMIYFFTP